MKDIRIIEQDDPCFDGQSIFKLCRMSYDDEGFENGIEHLHTFETLEELYRYTDDVYRSTLKPVIFMDENGILK